MVLWFLGLSFALVLMVFDTPLLDYRLVMLGSVLPWLDRLWAPPWVLHSVLFPVLVMSAVMVVFRGQRLRQRRWLGLAIGMFMHLLLAGTFTSGELFWWPALGFDVDGLAPRVPGLGLAIVLEAIGLFVLVWLARRLGLAQAERRDLFMRTGHIDRAVLR
jgi:hypothetical protein